MQNLLIEEGSVINITNVSLPKATFVKLQPQHVDFLEITNPRAVLEHALRNFSCVTKGDVIQLPFCNKNYHFELKEVQPQDAACIIETDCNVDFDAPVGYKEPPKNYGHGGSSQNSTTDSLSETLAKIPKQSAYANRNSACPSPALSSMSGTSAVPAKGSTQHGDSSSLGGGDGGAGVASNGVRIVDGKVVRPQNGHDSGNLKNDEDIAMMASQTGGTGVQRNAAIAVKAPQVDYWALNGGDGARLDGKKPAALKDSEGNELDVRKLRAEAAKRRMEAMKKENGETSMSFSCGKMVNGKVVNEKDTQDATKASGEAAPVPKQRKSRIGSKYSKLKKSGGFAFQGSANTFK